MTEQQYQLLEKLITLRKGGVISELEFERQKRLVLGDKRPILQNSRGRILRLRRRNHNFLYVLLGIFLTFLSIKLVFGLMDFIGLGKEKLEKRKVEIFNDVNSLRTIISENCNVEMSRWQGYQQEEYVSTSSTYELESKDYTKNFLSYFLKSDKEAYVETLNIQLSAYSKDETHLGLQNLEFYAEAIFKGIELNMPDGLQSAIQKGEEFSFKSEKFDVNFEVVQRKMDKYTLTIKSN